VLILLFVLIPTLVVATYAVVQAFRHRQPTSIESGVNAFRREMDALSPDAMQIQTRPNDESNAPAAPRRAPGVGPARPASQDRQDQN